MLHDVVDVKVVGDHRLHLRFSDGTAGTVDLAPLLTFTGVFAPLADPTEFARVTVDPELGTIVWPNGADVAPDTLYAWLTQPG